MKIYFAGPLFTPYVTRFISEHAEILRANGIDPFVPHEQPFASITAETVDRLRNEGLITQDDLAGRPVSKAIMELVRKGRLSRQQLGLPALTSEMVFDVDYAGLSTADAVLAILDGTQVDDGTACELGIFHALMLQDPKKKGIVGLMTDSRGIGKKDEGYGLNFFVLGLLEADGMVCSHFDEALAQLKTWAAEMENSQ